MSKSLILCGVMLAALLHTSYAANETTKDNDTVVRQPRYSRLEAPILLIRPVTKESTTLMRLPINRKTNPIPMAPMMGNGFVIRTKTDDGDDDEALVTEFISHFGKVVTRTDHGNSKNTEVLNSPIRHISLPPNVNYFIKNIQSAQPKKRFSTQPNFSYRHPAPMVVRQRPAGFLKKRNIRTETIQMTPQFRASPQIPVETRTLIESSLSSDDWTPTSSLTSPTLIHASENKQYQNPLFINSQKEKFAYTQHLMETPIKNHPFRDDDYTLPESKPTQTSFLSMTIAVDEANKIPSFKPKVSLRVATDEKIKNRTRLKPVREYQDESRKLNEDDQDKNGKENVPRQFESNTPAPIFVTPIEVATTKSTKVLKPFKHRFSAKLNDSCEVTCLMNIVNLDYDPVCGSDDQTYVNVGKFRCAKICGQLQLTIKHFGSCEDRKSM